jgi:hypothetical protein
MRSVSVACGEGLCSVEAMAVVCGRDLTVCFGGGQAPHIGAVALGSPRPSLADSSETSASTSVLCVLGHKEDRLAQDAATRLAASLGCQVVVTVGLHVDDASSDDIASLKVNYATTLDEIERCLKTLLCSGALAPSR